MTISRTPWQRYIQPSLHSLNSSTTVITVFDQSSTSVALPGLTSPGQCSSTAPKAAFVCDTKAHSHPSPEPRKWHMHWCHCCFTSCLLKYEAISCEWRMVRERGRLGTAQLCCSLWYCQGRVMALCSNSHHQTNVVWLWFSFPMHYHHSE